MTAFPGGYQAVPELAQRLPRASLPEWDHWLPYQDLVSEPPDGLVDHVRWHVEHEGWTLVGCRRRHFVYSVGLTQWGWPEMVIRLRRVTADMALHLMTHLAAMHQVHDRVLIPGREWTLECGPHVKIAAIPDDRTSRLCPVTRELFGEHNAVHAVEVVPD